MTTLPKPTVTVAVSTKDAGVTHVVDVAISREAGKGDSYHGEGSSVGEAVRGVVEAFVADRKFGEYLP